jgi:hypothetical protein
MKLLKNFFFILSIFVGLTLISCSPSSDNTKMYDISVSKSPPEGGTITPSADTTVEEGIHLKLHADNADKFMFSYWTGDVDSTSDNPLSITADQNYSLTANFEIKSYELTINTEKQPLIRLEIRKRCCV